MKRVIVCIIFVFALHIACVHDAKAQYRSFVSGNELFDGLQYAQDTWQYRYAAGYIFGVADTGNGTWFTFSPKVDRHKVLDTVTKYLVAHPQERNLPAAMAVVRALRTISTTPQKK